MIGTHLRRVALAVLLWSYLCGGLLAGEFTNVCKGLETIEVKDPDLIAFILARCTGSKNSLNLRNRPRQNSLTEDMTPSKDKPSVKDPLEQFTFYKYSDVERACKTDPSLLAIEQKTPCGPANFTELHLKNTEPVTRKEALHLERLGSFYKALLIFNKSRLREFLSATTANKEEIQMKIKTAESVHNSLVDALVKLKENEITWAQFNSLRATAREMSYELLEESKRPKPD